MNGPLSLGAPGLYTHVEPPLRALSGVRMDVCAFLGVAPRGPARVPLVDAVWRDDRPTVEPERPRVRSTAVAVESWDEYVRLYGAFEGSGLLPHAVAAFFAQGGRRAYIVRIVHAYPPGNTNVDRRDEGGVARGTLAGLKRVGGGDVILVARNEGEWGNRLTARVRARAKPLFFEEASTSELLLPGDTPLECGALLRLGAGDGARIFRFVSEIVRVFDPETDRRALRVTLALPLTAPPIEAEIVEATLEIDDRDGRTERLEGLGLSPEHPRFLATVLCRDSKLVFPDASFITSDLLPESALLSIVDPPARQFEGGLDRSADITPDDFFDPAWVPGDDVPRSGIHALAELSDVAMVVAPDLYSPRPMVSVERILDAPPSAGPTFAPCVDVTPQNSQESSKRELEGLRLDPSHPGDRARIIAWQRRFCEAAEAIGPLTALLDVPPGSSQRQILVWRASFASSFVAAYHPWIQIPRNGRLERVNPSAVAAGLIARCELLFGVVHGPANEIAAGAVAVTDAVAPAHHGELHQAGINVFLRERDGVRLTGARTLSRDASYRQLSVRRLVLMLRRALERELSWVAFEPNDAALQAQVRHLVRSYLRDLHRANAFRGATEEEAFFVRCDERLNTRYDTDAGRLVCEVGIAPAEPLEFLVLRVARDADGALKVEG